MFLVRKGLGISFTLVVYIFKNMTLKKSRIFEVIKGLFGFVNSILVSLPSRKSLTLNWSYGSILGIVLIFQILTGTFLAFYYTNDGSSAFSSVQYIMYEVNFG